MSYKFANVFISYAWADEKIVIPILDKLVKCGIKIQIDRTITKKKGGLELFDELEKAMKVNETPCALIFISFNSIDRVAVLHELEILIYLRTKGARIIPVFMDKYDELELSEDWQELLEDEQGNKKIVYFRNDNEIVDNLVKSIFNHYELDKSSNIVFHAGHRLPYSQILNLPKQWIEYPVLDFRLRINHDGDYVFSPTVKEWSEILDSLNIVKNALDELNLILLLGKSPVGFAACVANPWGRGSVVSLNVWNEFAKQVWEADYQPPEILFSPTGFEIKDIRKGISQNHMFVGFQENILVEIQGETDTKSNLVWLKTKRNIESSMIQTIVNETIKYLEVNASSYSEQNLYFGIPFGLVGLICWNIKSTGKVNVMEYRKDRIPRYLKIFTLR